jgi:hypothetical protein
MVRGPEYKFIGKRFQLIVSTCVEPKLYDWEIDKTKPFIAEIFIELNSISNTIFPFD